MNKTERGRFGSKLGAILAAAGSAVGLGNVWRFPYETGSNGGAAFILIYLLCILFLGLPVVLAEFAVGRHGKTNAARAFTLMGGSRHWRLIGFLGVLTGFLILSYYGVAAGWTLEYVFQSGINGFAGKGPEQFAADFQQFASDPLRPMLCLFIFLLLTCGIVVLGVQKGIERGAKMMMSLLFVFVLILVVCSLSLPNAMAGVEFLFKPDFSKVTGATFLAAMGQAFFSLSLGMGCLCTYASYFRSDEKLMNDAFSVASIDTCIAILSGLIIFPAAFSVGISPDAGPSLVFITLPNVFQQAFSALPLVSYCFSLLFYLLLAMAALTSSISMLEVVTAFVSEELQIRRRWAALGSSLFCLLLGICCSLSLGPWADYKIWGMGFFDLFDFLTAKILLPGGGFLIAVYVGWFADKKILRDEITNGGTVAVPLYGVFRFLLRYVAPTGILAIFLDQMGVF